MEPASESALLRHRATNVLRRHGKFRLDTFSPLQILDTSARELQLHSVHVESVDFARARRLIEAYVINRDDRWRYGAMRFGIEKGDRLLRGPLRWASKTIRPEVERGLTAFCVVASVLWMTALAAFPASAASECDGWLPDFYCDREARPRGHVAPMSMPYLFEDPYITTELNLVGIYHNFPSDSVFDGGEAGVIALQARIALTDRLAFIATKDGYTFLRPDNPILDNEEGFMDVTVGFKYAVIDDREVGLIVTPSLRYEIPLGSDGVLQGIGQGVIIPAVSAGYGPNNTHLVADFGAQLAIDGDKDSSSIFYNIHLDQAFEVDWVPGADFIVPFMEFNGITWVDSGDGSQTIETDLGRLSIRTAQGALHSGPNSTANLRFEGADVANLGSPGMAGETLITMAWGIRIPFNNGFTAGFSYERVLSQREDIFEQRLTWMLAYGF